MFTSFAPWIGNRFVLWPAWAALIEHSIAFLLLLLVLVGMTLKTERRRIGSWIAAAFILGLAGTILNAIGIFQFLIEYERTNYADRLHLLALFCLLIAAIPGLEKMVGAIKLRPRIFACCLMIGLTITSTALAYTSLPRHDALVTGRGWSTSSYDIETVKRIDRDAKDRPYVVLANQSVSAAAVATLGFKRYAGDVFFYPIPTGGPLYELYLHLTYQDQSLETIREAAELGQANLVYVVMNDYWWKSTDVADALEIIADRSWVIGDGKIRVAIFDLAQPHTSSTSSFQE
jgi:hypothetical protein